MNHGAVVIKYEAKRIMEHKFINLFMVLSNYKQLMSKNQLGWCAKIARSFKETYTLTPRQIEVLNSIYVECLDKDFALREL